MTEPEKNSVIELLALTDNLSLVARTLKVSIGTVSNYRDKYLPEIQTRRAKQQKGGHVALREKRDMLEKPTETKFVAKASSYLSDELLKELKLDMAGAKVFRRARQFYERPLEEIGFPWDEFVYTALSWFFDLVIKTWLREKSEREAKEEYETVMNNIRKAEIEEKKHEILIRKLQRT